MLLIVFRLMQGISFGGEFGTASTWVVEQAARSKYRAFWGAWVGFAIPIGLLLGFGSVILVSSLMTPEDFLAWGWRISFFVGFLVAIVGIVIRTRTEDSFVFQQHKTRATFSVTRPGGSGATCLGAFCAPPWSTRCSAVRFSSTLYLVPVT